MQLISRLKRNPVISNAGATVVLGGLNTLSRLIVLFLIASTFDPGVFGQVIFAISITDIAKVIADGGISTVAIRQFAIADSKEAESLLAGTTAVVRTILIILVYVGLSAFYLLTQEGFQATIGLIAGLQVITSLWTSYSINYFQAQLASEKVLIPAILTNTTMVFVIYLLAWRTSNIILILAIIPLFEIINGMLILRIYYQYVKPQLCGVSWSLIVELLRNCAPVFTMVIIVTIYTRLDVVVLSNFFDDSVVGFYGLAFRLTEPFLLIAGALSISIFSRTSFFLSSNTHARQVWPFLTRYGTILGVYGLVASMGLTLICPPLIALFFPAYVASIPILRILAAALFVRILNVGMTSVINASGRYSIITRIATFNLLSISTLLILLAPRFGASGAALALLIGEIINCIIQIVVSQRLFMSYRVLSSTPSAHP